MQSNLSLSIHIFYLRLKFSEKGERRRLIKLQFYVLYTSIQNLHFLQTVNKSKNIFQKVLKFNFTGFCLLLRVEGKRQRVLTLKYIVIKIQISKKPPAKHPKNQFRVFVPPKNSFNPLLLQHPYDEMDSPGRVYRALAPPIMPPSLEKYNGMSWMRESVNLWQTVGIFRDL